MSTAWNDSTNPQIIMDKNEIVESFKKHFFSSELKEESVGDQVTEIIFRKLMEQSNLAGTNDPTKRLNNSQSLSAATTRKHC